MVEAEIMHRFGLQGHLHYLESSLPEDIAAERSRWSWLKEAGLVGPALMLGHFLHPTTEMIREVVAAGVRMSWNPLSNGRLASGIADIPAYLKQSLSIGLGVDGEASSDRCDPFENMRMGLYSVRGMYKDPNALMPYDVLHMHTLGAAESLGVDDKVGSLTVGKYADMVFVEPPYSLLDSDSISTLVLSAGVEHVKEVFVGGLPVSSTSGTPTRTGVEWPPWEF
jgi:cytosine/adenosine deaminase-related metal-dependent hydrolase